MKSGVSHYTKSCDTFRRAFHGMQGVTTFQSECVNEDGTTHDFEGTVYVDGIEYLNISKGSNYMLFVNNPFCSVNENGDTVFTAEHPQQQWIFGYYNTLGRALARAHVIVRKRKYPKPILIW